MKVVLHHISTIDLSQRELIFSKTLDFIWRHTHCSAIRLNLYHIIDPDTGKQAADKEIKALLKSKKFKWKTVKNEGEFRSEILEVQNTEYQNQMRKSKAEIFRQGVGRNDILREPCSIFFSSMVAFGKA